MKASAPKPPVRLAIFCSLALTLFVAARAVAAFDQTYVVCTRLFGQVAPHALTTGSPVTLVLAETPQRMEATAIFVAKIIDPETRQSQLIFHNPDRQTYFFVDESGVTVAPGEPGAKRTQILKIRIQKDATCGAHAITNCILQYQIAKDGAVPPDVLAKRDQLFKEAYAAIYHMQQQQTDAEEGLLVERQIPHAWERSDDDASMERLFRHLQSGLPATMSAAVVQEPVARLTIELSAPDNHISRQTPAADGILLPSRQGVRPGHSTALVGAFELPGGRRFAIVQDSNESAPVVIEWKALREAPAGDPVRFLLLGAQSTEPRTVEAIATQLAASPQTSAQAEAVRRNQGQWRRGTVAELVGKEMLPVIVRRKPSRVSANAPELTVGTLLPSGADQSQVLVMTGQGEGQGIAVSDIAEVYVAGPAIRAGAR